MTNEQEVLKLATQLGVHSSNKESVQAVIAFAQAIRDQEAAKVAELERQLAEENERKKVWENLASDYANKNLELAQRAEQAEQRIAESQRQGPVAYYVLRDGIEEPLYFRYFCSAHRYAKDEDILPLYARPVVPPDVAEAVKELADWIATQRNDVPATGEEFAAAIRARSGK